MIRPILGEKQENKKRCGAASCLYILKMLGVEGNDTQATIMPEVSTLYKSEAWGSTPRNIGKFILDRCRAHQKAGVTVEQGPGDSNKGGRLYLQALRPMRAWFPESSFTIQASANKNWTRGPAVTAHPNLAILRGLVEVGGPHFLAHWVVQTHFNNQIQVMDPDTGQIETITDFNWWLAGNRNNVNAQVIPWASNGLDLEIRD